MDTLMVLRICLVSKFIGGKGMVFRAWAHKRMPLTRNGWYSGLVAPISSQISSIVGLLILYGLNMLSL